MKKILFALALCSPSAFSGGMASMAGSMASMAGDMVIETLIYEALDRIPPGAIPSTADLTQKVYKLFKGVPIVGNRAAETFMKVFMKVISSVIISSRAEEPTAFQKLFCGKASLKDGQYSVRSFNGLLCLVPYLYQAALKICKGVDGFEGSGCVRKGTIIMEKMGNAFDQDARAGAQRFPDIENSVAALLNPAAPPSEPLAIEAN